MDDEDDTAPEERSKAVEWFTTRAEQRAIERVQRREHKLDRKRSNREVLNWLTDEATTNTNTDNTEPALQALPKAEQRCQKDQCDAEQWRNHRAMIALIKSFEDTNTDPLETAEATSLIESERRLSKLKYQLEYLRQIAQEQSPNAEYLYHEHSYRTGIQHQPG